MADKNDQMIEPKNPNPYAPGGVNRSREGRGGPTTTGPGETSVSRHAKRVDQRSGLEDIGGTGTDMDDLTDDMDFDEGVSRTEGRAEKGRPLDEEFD
jgi:hypothetical protein